MARQKTRRIHVDQHVIRANTKSGADAPPLTIQTYKGSTKAHEVIIFDKEGEEVARVVYRPHQPLSCGARLWIETKATVVEKVRA